MQQLTSTNPSPAAPGETTVPAPRVVRQMSVGSTSMAEREVTLPDGRVRTGRPFVHRPPFVGVVPLRPGNTPGSAPEVLLVDQYRDAVGEVVREIPAGKIEPHELNEDPRQVAARELAEETGLVAHRWQPLIGGVLPSPGFTDEIARGLWAAWEFELGTRRVEDAHIHGTWFPLSDALSQIGTQVRDAKTIIALLLTERRWQDWPLS